MKELVVLLFILAITVFFYQVHGLSSDIRQTARETRHTVLEVKYDIKDMNRKLKTRLKLIEMRLDHTKQGDK